MKRKYFALIMLLATGAGYSLAQTLQAPIAARSAPSPSPTPPSKRGDRSPAVPVSIAPAPGSAGPTMNTPQHSPDQLDFGQVLDGRSATRTLSLTTNAPGYVNVTLPPGPFRVAEFREMAQTPNPSKINNGQLPA